jgi:phage tail-like protein
VLETGQIIVRLDNQVIQTVPLTAAGLTIGRTPDNTLPLPNPLVSRRHADLQLGPEGAVITDRGSANGTFIGGTQLLPNQPQPMLPGVGVQIGPFVLTYEPPGGIPAPEDHPPPREPELPPEPPPAEIPVPTEVPAEQPAEQPADAPATDTTVADVPMTVVPTPIPVVLEPLVRPPVAPQSRPPALPTRDQISRYINNLPVIFHDNDFLRRYLLIFESIWEPLEHRQDHIDMYLSPRTSPAEFLPWIAGWIGISLAEHWPEGRRRQLLSEGVDLYRWRGTRYGMARMIEVCTGLTPEITDLATGGSGRPPQPFVFRVVITIPPDSGVDPAFVEELIRTHKPAHAGYILELRS